MVSGSGSPLDESFRRLETDRLFASPGHCTDLEDGWQADDLSRIDSPSPLIAQVYGTLSLNIQ